MNDDLLNSLHLRAKYIAAHVAKHQPKGRKRLAWDKPKNDWASYNHPHNLRMEITGTDSVKFHYNQYAWMEFTGVGPKDIIHEKLSDPVLLNEEVKDADSGKIVNKSEKTTLKRTYSYSETKTKTFEQSAGVAVANELRVLIGTGDASPVKAEAEITSKIEASYNKSWGGESSVTKEVTVEADVAPQTIANITSVVSKSNFEQDCEYIAKIEHGVRIYSHEDFDVSFDSVDDLALVLRGRAPSNWNLAAHYQRHPMGQQYIDQITGFGNCLIRKKIRFSEASSGSITVSDKPYKD